MNATKGDETVSESSKGLTTYRIFLGMLALIIVLGVGFALGMRFEQRFATETMTTGVADNGELPSSNGKSDSVESKKHNTPATVSRDVSNEAGDSKEPKSKGLAQDNEGDNTVDLFEDLRPFTGKRATGVVISGVSYNSGYIAEYYNPPVRWNLDGNFQTVKIAVGVPDDAYYSEGSFDVLLDEEIVGRYGVSKDGGLKEFTIDVAGGRILVVSGSSHTVAVVKAIGEKKE